MQVGRYLHQLCNYYKKITERTTKDDHHFVDSYGTIPTLNCIGPCPDGNE